MRTSSVAELARSHRPAQFTLLEGLVELFAGSPAVTHLLVRGSLALGHVDRLSDVDLVIGVEDSRFTDLVGAHDLLMRTERGSVLPAWRDRIVGDMGGVGFVHLVPLSGHLQQVDLYFAPQSVVDRVKAATDARAVLVRSTDRPPASGTYRIPPVDLTSTALLVEVLILEHMIRKRIQRAQEYIAYAEMNMLATAVKDLVKLTLAPTSRSHGWYHLDEEVGGTPLGRACLDDLRGIVTGPAVPTTDSLDDALQLAMAIARRAAPEAVDELWPTLVVYWDGASER